MDSTTTTTTTTSLLSELICHLSSGGPAEAIRHCLFAGVGSKIHMAGRFLVPILCLRMTRFHAMNLGTSSQKMVTCYLAFENNALLCTGIV
ncbi:unnamed protein product, partial [Musa acuminata var. zebrina]